ncbi:MAG: hypothetical protein ABEK16_04625 [Candidatus Nanohalobium sp.]
MANDNPQFDTCERAKSVKKWGERTSFVGDKQEVVEAAKEKVQECE